MNEKQERADLEGLLRQPAFLRFLDRSIQQAKIFDQLEPTADGTDSRHLFHEGRRSLGLDLLRDASRGIPAVDDPQTAMRLLSIQVLREGAQSTPEEKPRGRRSRYDDDSDDGAADGAGG